MPTIIDTLITVFTLDNTQYTKAAKEQQETNRKLTAQEIARTKNADELAKRQVDAYRKVRNEVVGLLAIFTAGRGIKDFVRDITASDASLGRLATNIGQSTEDISSWQSAAERMGGSAGATASSFQTMNDQLQQLAVTGNASMIPFMRALGVQAVDAQGKIKSTSQIYMDLSRAVQNVPRGRANYLLGQMGIDQGTRNLILSGPQKLQAELNRSKANGLVSEKDAENAQKLSDAYTSLRQNVDSFARALTNDVSPSVIELMRYFEGLIQANRPWIEGKVKGAFESFVQTIKSVDWKALEGEAVSFYEKTRAALIKLYDENEPRIRQFITEVHNIVTEIGGWGNAAKLLFEIWLGAKGLQFLTSIAGIAAAFGRVGLSILGVGEAVTGLLLLGAPLAAFVAGINGGALNGNENSVDTKKAIDQWNDRQKKGIAGYGPGDTITGDPRTLPPSQDNSLFGQMLRGLGFKRHDDQNISDEYVESVRPLLDTISKGESGAAGYNATLANGKWTDGPVDIQHSTVQQVLELQQGMLDKQHAAGIGANASSAIGKYQFTQSTILDMIKKHGIASNQVFDKPFQDRLAIMRWQEVTGTKRLPTQEELAQIWSSVSKNQAGQGAYAGQRATTSYDETGRAIDASRQRLSGMPGGTSPVAFTPSNASRYHSNDNRQTHNDHSVATNVGTVVIHTAATDAEGIAKGIRPALSKYAYVTQASRGMTT